MKHHFSAMFFGGALVVLLVAMCVLIAFYPGGAKSSAKSNVNETLSRGQENKVLQLLADGDLDGARTMSGQIIAVDPANIAALMVRAKLLMLGNDRAGAENIYRMILQKIYPDAGAGNNLAVLLAAQGMNQEAENLLQRIYGANSSHPVLSYNLYQIMLRNGRIVPEKSRTAPPDMKGFPELLLLPDASGGNDVSGENK